MGCADLTPLTPRLFLNATAGRLTARSPASLLRAAQSELGKTREPRVTRRGSPPAIRHVGETLTAVGYRGSSWQGGPLPSLTSQTAAAGGPLRREPDGDHLAVVHLVVAALEPAACRHLGRRSSRPPPRRFNQGSGPLIDAEPDAPSAAKQHRFTGLIVLCRAWRHCCGMPVASQLVRAFADTGLEGRDVNAMQVPGTDEVAFEVDREGVGHWAAWECARPICNELGLWPVITDQQSPELFSRFLLRRSAGRPGHVPIRNHCSGGRALWPLPELVSDANLAGCSVAVHRGVEP